MHQNYKYDMRWYTLTRIKGGQTFCLPHVYFYTLCKQ